MCPFAVMRPQPGNPLSVFLSAEQDHGWVPLGRPGRVDADHGTPPGVPVFGASCRGRLKTFRSIGRRDLEPKG